MGPEKKFIKECIPRGIFIKGDNILLVNKIGEPHHFLPGGRLEQGESLYAGLKREIREELNLLCHIKNYVGAIEHCFEDDVKIQYEVSHFFVIDLPGMELSKEPKSAETELSFCWSKISELKKLDIRPPPVRELLKELALGQKKPFWASTMTDR